jgi:hypothetical protein
MKTLAPERIHESVDQVFGEMDFTDEASAFEVNGRRVYFVVRPTSEPISHDPQWSDEQSKRRHHLIDLKLSGAISPIELLELAQLNEDFERYASRGSASHELCFGNLGETDGSGE